MSHGNGYQQVGGGYKRSRDEYAPPPMSGSIALLAALLYLGDTPDASGVAVNDESIIHTVRQIKRELRAGSSEVPSILLDCAASLPTKTQLYALVAGIVNVEEPDLIPPLLSKALEAISSSMQPGGDFRRARLVLRFLCALVVTGVVQPTDALAAVQSFVDTANTILTQASSSSASPSSSSTWQPYTDWLVYSALIALPWGGPELAGGIGDQALQHLLTSAKSYIDTRPTQSTTSFKPFAAAVKEDDLVADSDSAAASFLPLLYQALADMTVTNTWELAGIPRVHIIMEVKLAEGDFKPMTSSTDNNSDSNSVLFPPTPPTSPPVIGLSAPNISPEIAGSLVWEAFPPRGILRLLDPQHTIAGRPLIERIVAEEYILDTMALFDADRVECAKRLTTGLTLPYPYTPLLAEVLFSQLLMLPRPVFKPIMVSTLMVDVCKLLKDFPRAMSACVRECFSRMNVMDPALRLRLAEWLAYHLSNFDYLWPWARWEHVLKAPLYDGQRRFCVAVMGRLIRLSYWEKIQSVIPAEFQPLLPPKPEPVALAGGGGDVAMGDDSRSSTDELEGQWATKMLILVREKTPPEGIDKWVADNGLEEVLEGKLGVLRMMIKCLLTAGAKSYTHMIIALERYYGPLALLVKETGIEGETAMVEAAAQGVWRLAPQRAAMAVDRMMTQRLVSADAIVNWVFTCPGLRSLNDEASSGAAWEILQNTVNKTIARVQDAVDELQVAEGAVNAKRAEANRLAEAGDGNATAAAAETEAAEVLLKEKQGYVEEASAAQQRAIILVIQKFFEAFNSWAAMPASRGKGEEDDDSESTEEAALHEYMVAWFRSILRRYNVQVAAVADKVREKVESVEGVSEKVREIVDEQLRL